MILSWQLICQNSCYSSMMVHFHVIISQHFFTFDSFTAIPFHMWFFHSDLFSHVIHSNSFSHVIFSRQFIFHLWLFHCDSFPHVIISWWFIFTCDSAHFVPVIVHWFLYFYMIIFDTFFSWFLFSNLFIFSTGLFPKDAFISPCFYF